MSKQFLGLNSLNKLVGLIRSDMNNKSDVLHNHDSIYSKLNHTHDDRYYTESEVNNLLNGKSNTSHTHDYLPLTGGTMKGCVTFDNRANDKSTSITVYSTDAINSNIALMSPSTKNYTTIYPVGINVSNDTDNINIDATRGVTHNGYKVGREIYAIGSNNVIPTTNARWLSYNYVQYVDGEVEINMRGNAYINLSEARISKMIYCTMMFPVSIVNPNTACILVSLGELTGNIYDGGSIRVRSIMTKSVTIEFMIPVIMEGLDLYNEYRNADFIVRVVGRWK